MEYQDHLEFGSELVTTSDLTEFVDEFANAEDATITEEDGLEDCVEKKPNVLELAKVCNTNEQGDSTSSAELYAEMEKSVSDTIKECVTFLRMDPREYHPFYLRVYKYIALGQQLGNLGDNAETSLWQQYDNLAVELFEKSKTEKIPFSGEKSPYMTYILIRKTIQKGAKLQKPKQDESERQNFFNEIEEKARNLALEVSSSSIDIRSDLSTRLKFFSVCKNVTLPWDCVDMNRIWSKFASGFEELVIKNTSLNLAKAKKRKASGMSNVAKSSNLHLSTITEGKHHLSSISSKPSRTNKKLRGESTIASSAKFSEEVDKQTQIKMDLTEYKLKWIQREAQQRNKQQQMFLKQKIALWRKRRMKGTSGSVALPSPILTPSISVTGKQSAVKLKTRNRQASTLARKSKATSDPEGGNHISTTETANTKICVSKSRKSSKKSRLPSKFSEIESDGDDHQPQTSQEMISNKDGQFVCEECGKAFVNRSSCLAHRRNVHHTNSHQCPSCPIQLKSVHHLWRHFQAAHTGYKSTKEDTTPNPSAPRKSRTISNPNRIKNPTICEICGKDFCDSANLRRHFHQVHGDGVLPGNFLVCPVCAKSYKNKDTLSQHIRQMHDGEDYRCDICRRMCQTAGKLWKHKQEVHNMTDLPPPAGVTVYTCEYCGQQFLRGLEAHVKKSHPQHLEQFQMAKKEKVLQRQRDAVAQGRWKRGSRKQIEQRKLLRELGPETAASRGLVPKWMLPRECPMCGDMILGIYFGIHLRKHGTGDEWVRKKVPKKKVQQNSGKFRDKLKEYMFEKELVSRATNGGKHATVCTLCKFEAEFLPQMKIHFLTIHPESCAEVIVLRPQEPASFSLSSSFQSVSPSPAATTPVENMNCRHCSVTGMTESQLRSHLEAEHSEQCWRCPACSKVMVGPAEMAKHFQVCANNKVGKMEVPEQNAKMVKQKASTTVSPKKRTKSTTRAKPNSIKIKNPSTKRGRGRKEGQVTAPRNRRRKNDK